MNNDRDFKGIWIPKEIWADQRLSALEKIILMEIDSLDNGSHGCYATNDQIADFCQCSVNKVKDAVSKLASYGYIDRIGFDGRRRTVKSNVPKSTDSQAKNVRRTGEECVTDGQFFETLPLISNITSNITSIIGAGPKQALLPKKKYGSNSNVLLSDQEFEKLHNDYPDADAAIEFLSSYITEKGYKAKSHYLSLKRWVFNALHSEQLRQQELAQRQARINGYAASNANSNDPFFDVMDKASKGEL